MNKPSEALECLEIVGCLITKETEKGYIMLKEDKEFEKEYNIIKQALIELQQIKNDKPSEALEYLEHIMQNDFNMMIATYPPIPAYNGITKNEMFNTIKQALLSKQISVENSEAMKCLEKLELLTCDFEWYKDNINTIKQALIQAERLEKGLSFSDGSLAWGFKLNNKRIVAMPENEYDKMAKKELAFEIIKKKKVRLGVLMASKNLEYYNDNIVLNCNCLTQEEFNLLKEVLCDE